MKVLLIIFLLTVYSSFSVIAQTDKTQLQLFFENKKFLSSSELEKINKLERIKKRLLADDDLDVKHKSIEIYLIDYVFLDRKSNFTKFSKRMMYLLLSSEVKDEYLYNTIKFHLARNLFFISPKRSKKLNEEVLRYARKNDFISMEVSCIELLVDISYNYNEFQKSANLYSQIIFKLKEPSPLKVSMLNNLSLTYIKLKKYKLALYYNQIAIKEFKLLKKDKDLVSDYLYFLLIANKGVLYFYLQKYDLSKKDLLIYYDFIKKQPKFNEHAPKKLWILYQTYHYSKNLKSKKEIRNFLIEYFKKEIDFTKKMSASFYLKQIYFLENELKSVYKWDKISENLSNEIQKKNRIDNDEINEELMSFSIQNINKKNQINNELNKKKITWFIVIVFLVVISLFLIFYNRYQVQRKKLEISTLRQQNILQEITIKDNKINELQLYVELKNTMNKIFVEKIKSLRKRKEISSEELLKELQMQLSNLLQIDKNNIPLTVLSDKEKKEFYDVLLTQNPSLSRIELELCSYLRLNLSSKEIASILNLSDGSVRVYKTRLKEKLNISRNVSVETYLKNLMNKEKKVKYLIFD
jgi:DNA-binding CsgD family transcriptional regulator